MKGGGDAVAPGGLRRGDPAKVRKGGRGGGFRLRFREGEVPACEVPLHMGEDVACRGQGVERQELPARFFGETADILAGECPCGVRQLPKACQ